MSSYELTHLKKMVRGLKTKSLLFCLRYDPPMVFWRQNHITFTFIQMMSHDLLVQMAYSYDSRPSYFNHLSLYNVKSAWSCYLWDKHFCYQLVWTSAKHRIIISPWFSLSNCGTHIYKRQYKIQWKGREPKQSNRKERVE